MAGYDDVLQQIRAALQPLDVDLHVHNAYLLFIRTKVSSGNQQSSSASLASLVVNNCQEVVLHPNKEKKKRRKALIFSIQVEHEGARSWEIVGTILHTVSGTKSRKATLEIKKQNILQSIPHMAIKQRSSLQSTDFVHLILGDFNTDSATTKVILTQIRPRRQDLAGAPRRPDTKFWHHHE